MQVYKCFFQILKKQKGQIIMYLCIFLTLSLIMSVQGAENKGTEFVAENYSFSVFDEDNSSISKQLVSYLSKKNEVVEIEDNETAIQDELYNRNTNCVIRIPEGFGESVKGEKKKNISMTVIPGTVYGEMFEGEINGYVSMLQNYLHGGFAEEEAMKKAEETLALEAKVELSSSEDEGVHSKLYYFFSYVPYIFLCVCVVAITPILITFRRKGVRERMESSAYPASRLNLSLFGGVITAGIGLVLLHCIMVAALSKGSFFSQKGLLFVGNEICFTIVALTLVFLLGKLVAKQEVLSMVANVVGLGMSFLGGVFVPLSMLGDGVIKIAQFLPSYWYTRASQWIDFYHGGSKMELFGFYGIQILFAVAFLCVGIAYGQKSGKSIQKK